MRGKGRRWREPARGDPLRAFGPACGAPGVLSGGGGGGGGGGGAEVVA